MVELHKRDCVSVYFWVHNEVWSLRVAGSSGERSLLSGMSRGCTSSRSTKSKTTYSQPEHLMHPKPHLAHTACYPRLQLKPDCAFLEEAGDLDHSWCQDPALPPPDSCIPGLPPRLPAQPQPQSFILVHEEKLRNLAEDLNVAHISVLSYPVLSGDIKILLMPHSSLETSTASFSNSNSLDLSQPFMHSRDSYFSRDHSGLVLFILMWLINYALQIFKQLMFIFPSIESLFDLGALFSIVWI